MTGYHLVLVPCIFSEVLVALVLQCTVPGIWGTKKVLAVITSLNLFPESSRYYILLHLEWCNDYSVISCPCTYPTKFRTYKVGKEHWCRNFLVPDWQENSHLGVSLRSSLTSSPHGCTSFRTYKWGSKIVAGSNSRRTGHVQISSPEQGDSGWRLILEESESLGLNFVAMCAFCHWSSSIHSFWSLRYWARWCIGFKRMDVTQE